MSVDPTILAAANQIKADMAAGTIQVDADVDALVALVPAPPPFVPSAIANLGGWWKADSLTLADGASVASWPDSSANGFTAVQATPANQPTFKANQRNGLPAVLFNGSSDRLTTGADDSFLTGPGLTVFAVVSYAAVTATSAIIGSGTGGLEYRMTTTGKMQLQSGNVGSISIATQALSANTFTIVAADYANVSGGTANHYANGSPAGSATSTLVLTAGRTMTIGALTSTEFLNGALAELVVYDRVLTSTERGQVDTYLSGRYAITVTG